MSTDDEPEAIDLGALDPTIAVDAWTQRVTASVASAQRLSSTRRTVAAELARATPIALAAALAALVIAFASGPASSPVPADADALLVRSSDDDAAVVRLLVAGGPP